MKAQHTPTKALRLVLAEEVSPGVMVYVHTDGLLLAEDLRALAKHMNEKAARLKADGAGRRRYEAVSHP